MAKLGWGYVFEFSFIHHCKNWFPCHIYVDISKSVLPLDLVSKARFKLEGVCRGYKVG